VDPSYAHRSAVLTAAVDNNAWWRGAAPFAANDRPWEFDTFMGDANFFYVDPKVEDSALGWRNESANGVVRHLTNDRPSEDGSKTAYQVDEFRNEHRFAVMPRTDGDGTGSTLYIAALIHPGEKKTEMHAELCDPPGLVPGVDGAGLATSIIYTENFQQHREFGESGQGGGWKLAAAAPQGAQRIWALAGRPDPAYFAYAENDDNETAAMFKKTAGSPAWAPLPGITDPLFPVPYCAVNGPLFPNPYDPTVVYVITSGSVWSLTGSSFTPEAALTKLITRSGAYPMADNYEGGRTDNVGDTQGHDVHQSQARKLSTLVDVEFDAADPYRTVAASAFGSVFFKDQRETFWRDLTPFLPLPTTAISSVAIAHDGVYVGFEGRSAWKISLPELAPIAAFFESVRSTSELAILRTSDGAAAPGIAVTVTVMATPTTPAQVATVLTGNDGGVPYPPGTSASSLQGLVVQLVSAGSADMAPALRVAQVP
jgi:hypothetical protein